MCSTERKYPTGKPWAFVKLILPHEPIRRGGGKPHMCEQLYRDGGTTVYVCSRHPNGLTGDDYWKLQAESRRCQVGLADDGT